MILERLFGMEKRHFAGPITGGNLSNYLYGSPESTTGRVVTVSSALSAAPFWAGLNVLSSDVSQIPLDTYRRRADGGREKAVDHPTFMLLRRHTGQTTSNLWLSITVNQAICYGTSYSQIHRSGPDNYPTKLENIPFTKVRPTRRAGILAYEIIGDDNAVTRRISEDDMFVIPGLMMFYEWGQGLSVVEFAKNTIGQWLAGHEYENAFFKNNGAPVGWITAPPLKDAEAKKNWIKEFQARHTGQGKAHKFGVLDDGQQWIPAGINPKDSMLIDLLKMTKKDVASVLNLPPHKLGDESLVSYSSLEQENQSYLEGGLGVWLSRIEFESNHKLFREDEKQDYFVEFNRNNRLRADTPTRYNVYTLARAAGILSANECRILENLNPYEGGDSYDNPNITIPDDQPDTDEEPEPEANNDRQRVTHRDLLLMQLSRATDRLLYQARSAAKKPDRFLAWLNGIEEDQGIYLRNMLDPVSAAVCVFTEGEPEHLTGELVKWCCGTVRERMLEACECPAAELPGRVSNCQGQITAACRSIATAIVIEGNLEWNTEK